MTSRYGTTPDSRAPARVAIAHADPLAGLKDAEAVFPLNEFYARTGLPLPRIELLPPSGVPEPWHRLLVHARDMTPTLQEHHRSGIHIEVLGRQRNGDAYSREVILRLDSDGRAVEFGASRIALDLLPPPVRQDVLQERLPIGHILKARDLEHRGGPSAFFRVEADEVMSRSLGVEQGRTLYGRRNTLWDGAGRAICEVVEILPPG